MSIALLSREVARLRAHISRRTEVPADPLEFARAVGLEELDDWQVALLRSEAARLLLNISRQAGKSTISAVVALRRALSVPRSLVLIMAPSERQAKETFGKAAGFYRALGFPIPAESSRKLGVELLNGSRIEALPGAEKTVRGFSGVDLLILDEAARVADELYFAVRPMLAVSGGRLLMMSTPYGKRGAFFEEWTGGVGWERYLIPAEDCPRISSEFLEEERRTLPPRVYRQEYECSFEDLEDQMFAHEIVEAAITSKVGPLFGG
jgi:hypothetical protein